MANVTTVDVTTFLGADKFPLKENDVYGLVETIASQNIRSAKSTNRIVDGFYDYDVTDGSVAIVVKESFGNAFSPFMIVI